MNTAIVPRRNFIRMFGTFLVTVFLWPLQKVCSGSNRKETRNASDDGASISIDNMKSGRVAVVPCTDYDPEMVFRAVSKALNDIGYTVPQGIRVLIKPNIMAQNTPDQAATTHPSVVDALCRIFSDARCSITIGDSSAFYQGGGTERGMQTTGMTAVAKKYHATILPFERTSLRKITSGRALKPFWITAAVMNYDLVVNVPKLKIHELARYSGAIKNMYGCIPGGTKQIYHEQFQHHSDYKEYWGEVLTDVYAAVRPGLTIMDAIYGLDQHGPAANGKPHRTGVVLASENGVALDCVTCAIIGFEPRWVPAVRAALERGMTKESEIVTLGTLPHGAYVKLPDKNPSKTSDYLFHKIIMTPRIHPHHCDRSCRACIDMCALKAITVDGAGLLQIDASRCIKCYCCAEQCPHHAIRLHGGVVNHAIRAARKLMKI